MKIEEWLIPRFYGYMLPSGVLTERGVAQLRDEIWQFYGKHERAFVWRETHDPYHIFVSEIMLQQTQTDRVVPKFEQFVKTFPSFEILARAPLREVLVLWQGLGYNRRARALHESARLIVEKYGGCLPNDTDLLDELPGIGPATAASVAAFAFNSPTVFIETNIRSVFITFCFSDRENISDKDLLPLVKQTLDQENPRHWYYALMDYGVMLKKRFPNPSRRSKHHSIQSKFEGSERQIRGMIIRLLTQLRQADFAQLCAHIEREPERIERNLKDLCREALVREHKGFYFLPK